MSDAARRPGLDLLRVLAVVAVAWFHFGFRMQATGEAGPLVAGDPGIFARYGYLGVSVFFAISGYVISISTEGRDPFGFAVARVARLWPTFVLCMSLTALVTLAVPGFAFSVTLPQYLANLTMLSPFLGQPFMDGAYWSIVAEIVFYAWVGLLMTARLWARFQVPIALVWLAIAALDQALIGSDTLRRLFLTDFAGFFAFGMMLRARERGAAGATAVLAAAYVQAIAGAAVFAGGLVRLYGGEPFSQPLIAAVVAVALVVLALATRPVRTGLPEGLVAIAGRATYPFYLLHQHIGYAAFLLLLPLLGFAGTTLALLAGVVFVSLAITLCVEIPAARIVRRLGEAVRARALALVRRPA
ncbi:acyltransferase family protein [Stappia sp.]|uniref:acyltransferase family protein n=1 Tax=Stappia sp. TaxID=1870903 RepID=UPI003D0CCC4C